MVKRTKLNCRQVNKSLQHERAELRLQGYFKNVLRIYPECTGNILKPL